MASPIAADRLPRQGDVIFARVFDPNGQNPKTRRVAVLTETARITQDSRFVVVGITGRLQDEIPDHMILLPWAADGSCRTGLNKKCAAHCRWLIEISAADVHEIVGTIPPEFMRRIIAMISGAE